MPEYRMKFNWDGDYDALTTILKPFYDELDAQKQEPPETEVRTDVVILPTYGSLHVIKEICEPWIEAWSGDEWGEVMSPLAHAIHIDYGLSDEDLAVLAKILWKNINEQNDWMIEEGRSYGLDEPEYRNRAAAECRKVRDRWTTEETWGPTKEAAKATLDSLPSWVFEDVKPESASLVL